MRDPAIKLYDAVTIKALRQPIDSAPDCFNTRQPRVGDVAYVIDIYENPPGYELECSASNGVTEWLCSFSTEAIELEKVA